MVDKNCDIKVCYTCDNNYAEYTAVSIASVIKNSNANDNLTFYVISHNISDENREKIEKLKYIKDFNVNFITPKEEIFNDFKNIKTTEYLPLASFFRLKIASLIQNEDKIIYLDPDTIIEKSLSEFYGTAISNYFCAGIPDISYKRLGKRLGFNENNKYINSGVLLVNLKKWRDENAEEKFINNAKQYENLFILGDQDIINKSFENQVLIVNNKWNVQVINFYSRSDYSQKFNILHYTGSQKPWKFSSYIPQKEVWFKYRNLTDYPKYSITWHILSNISAFFAYLKHRPLFFLRPGFFKSIYYIITQK